MAQAMVQLADPVAEVVERLPGGVRIGELRLDAWLVLPVVYRSPAHVREPTRRQVCKAGLLHVLAGQQRAGDRAPQVDSLELEGDGVPRRLRLRGIPGA